MARRRETPAQVLAKLRRLCLRLPETRETPTWGHPNFRVREKIFAAFHEDRAGSPCIWLKADPALVADLGSDARFSPSRHGAGRWIGIRADRRLDWALVRELATESYRITAPKRLAALVG
jgi:predicted DNA-binding protein (MmcQ/YjbR family)